MYTPRNYSLSKFKKQTRISDEMHAAISRIKGRKTMAGKIDEMLGFYLEAKKLK